MKVKSMLVRVPSLATLAFLTYVVPAAAVTDPGRAPRLPDRWHGYRPDRQLDRMADVRCLPRGRPGQCRALAFERQGRAAVARGTPSSCGRLAAASSRGQPPRSSARWHKQ